MSPTIWLGLVIAAVIIALTPGAGAINTMANSISVGWARSLWGILGQEVALVVHIAIVAAGVGVLVASSPLLFNVIRIAGAAYLVYLGIRQWRSRPQTDSEALVGPGESPWSLARRGLFVNLTNPKAVVFFLAFTPQFIRPAEPLPAQYLVLAATIVGIDLVVMWFFYAAAAKGLRRVTRGERGQTRLNRLFGGLFVAVGALLVAVH